MSEPTPIKLYTLMSGSIVETFTTLGKPTGEWMRYEDHARALAAQRTALTPAQSGRGEPASPLLPGLERAAEIDALEAEIHRIDYERMKMADALREILDYPLDSDVINAAAQMKFIAVRAFTSPIAAEISRIKGEGRGRE